MIFGTKNRNIERNIHDDFALFLFSLREASIITFNNNKLNFSDNNYPIILHHWIKIRLTVIHPIRITRYFRDRDSRGKKEKKEKARGKRIEREILAEKPIMRSRRRRIAPFTKKPPIVSTCTASGCNDPARSRLPRLRYNQDFHSRDERERERKGRIAQTRERAFVWREMKSLSGQIFSACVESFPPAGDASFMASLEYRGGWSTMRQPPRWTNCKRILSFFFSPIRVVLLIIIESFFRLKGRKG